MPSASQPSFIRTVASAIANKGGPMRRLFYLLALLVMASSTWAQNESQLGADFRKERASFSDSCSSLKSLLGCAQVLVTDHPIHIAVGSIAPQNGFGAGLAFVAHYTPNESWRLSWNADAVGSINGSWRAGTIYRANSVRVPTETPGLVRSVMSDEGESRAESILRGDASNGDVDRMIGNENLCAS